MTNRFDVVGIGSAIVDVLAMVDEVFITKNNLTKGSMGLVDEASSKALYAKLGQTKECSGGSVANTLAGIASLGGKPAFLGKVAKDQLGEIFAHDMKSVGVYFVSKPAESGPATATCMICVTPDAQRTMSTFLGACTQMTEADMDEDIISQSQVLYIEGYQWDMPAAKAAIRKAIAMAKRHGRKVALTLSDTFCVDRFRDEFMALVVEEIDILFANESEITALTRQNNFDDAIAEIQGKCEVALITRSEKGAVVVTKDTVKSVAVERVEKLVDTTGAGDLFAAGFLYGYTRGWAHVDSAKLGNNAAAQIIQQLGARSMEPLNKLLAA
jgi:sugar/nucleoside kinase (ribokinase family)